MKKTFVKSCSVWKRLLITALSAMVLVLGCSSPLGSTTAGNGNQGSGSILEGQLVAALSPEGSIASIEDLVSPSSRNLAQSTGGFQIIDALTDTTYSRSMQSFNQDFKAQVIDHMGHLYVYEYSTEEYPILDEAMDALKTGLENQGLEVLYVEPNYLFKALDAPSTLAVHNSQRWHYNMINAPQAWEITGGSMGTKMAVLDTGIDHNHPALTNFVDQSLGRTFAGGTTMDVQGHGTHVAGTIASYGPVSGVMQQGTLIAVKVLGDNGSGSMSGITQGIIYAAEIGADVVNMSLGGGGYNQSMNNAIDFAISQGTIVVAATGNDSRNSLSYPAAYAGAIAVGSVTSSRTRSSFSNYGTGLDLVAPGSSIYSTYPNGGYRSLSGTSMATPHVAGVLGLMRSANPDLSVAQARAILTDTAQYAGAAWEYGAGIADAYAAVVASLGDEEPPVQETLTTLSSDKEAYFRGDSLVITARVRDQEGNPLSGASVTFSLSGPNGISLTSTRTTMAGGEATWQLNSGDTTPFGLYTVEANASLEGFVSSADQITFSFIPTRSFETFTVLSADKEAYLRGENASITAVVTDDLGEQKEGASVTFTITRPNGTTLSNTISTNSEGVATWVVSSSPTTLLGTYGITANTTLEGYSSSSATTSLEFVEPIPGTSTSVSTDKAVYQTGERVIISASVMDLSSNSALASASLGLTITRPNGTAIVLDGLSSASGGFSWELGSSADTAAGEYLIQLTASKEGYGSSTGETTVVFETTDLVLFSTGEGNL